MPYRLKVDLDGRRLRFPLGPGVHVIGAAPGSDLRIPHPSVSRRHAELEVTGEGVRLRDAGSTNGTSVGYAKIGGEVALEPGARCAFGSVEAWLEEIPEGDLEAGIALELPPTPPLPETPRIAAATARLTQLEAFVLQRLPSLVERLVDASPEEAVQLVGSTLFHSLPARRVEITRREGEAEGVLFSGGEDDGDGGDLPWSSAITADMTLRLGFADPEAADTYEPLAHTSAALLRLALGRTDAPASPAAPRAAAPPPLPDPPTVVPSLKRLYERAWRVADGNVSVLIRGESGTGKEVLARYVHAASPRAEARLVTLNCAALPRDLLEAELFGVEKGAATGVTARPGKFELAHDGTLFLDEIGDMALETQAKILRVLQEHEVYRLGGNEPRPAEVRVIAATNRDLETMLEDGGFRRDLYHRIADWVVEMPPLRRRKADIPNLAAYFLSRECRDQGRYAAGVSRAALGALMRYRWPGNVRELEKEMARAVLFLDDGALLETEHLRPEIVAAQGETDDEGLKEILEDYERRVLARALSDADGDTARVAEELKIARSTLYRRLKALGIEP